MGGVRREMSVVRAVATALVAAAVASSAAVARADEDVPLTALREDLVRIVEAQESGGWRIDRYEIEEMMPTTLLSVCQVAPDVRVRLLADLDARIVAAGGPFAEAWATNPDLSAHKKLLSLHRTRLLLAEAHARAATECPPYLPADPAFRGVQTDFRRVTLNLETGGMLQLRRMSGQWTYGGGGVVRALLGYGTGRVTVAIGGEFSGGPMLRPGTQNFVINYFPAVPIMLRVWDHTWHWDFEVAPVALFQADDFRISFGMRVGGAVGVMARRSRGVLPWAGVQLGFETYPGGARPPTQFLRGGLRVGVIWN